MLILYNCKNTPVPAYMFIMLTYALFVCKHTKFSPTASIQDLKDEKLPQDPNSTLTKWRNPKRGWTQITEAKKCF